MKGSYIILIKINKDSNITIGKLGNISFEKGFYLYVGSALNGLEQRITRHLKDNKKLHWHIDYLLKHAKIIDIFYKESIISEECEISEKINEYFQSIKGFGCSDCRCKSHLFYGDYTSILNNISRLDMIRYIN